MVEIANNNETAPDFSAAAYAAARAAMKAQAPNATDEIIVATLGAIWKAQKEAEAVVRAQNEAAEAAAAAEQARLDAERDELFQANLARERELARLEDMKKNKTKYVAIAVGVAVPNEAPIDVPIAIMRQLKLFKRVPLYLLTDEALQATDKEKEVFDDGLGGFAFEDDGAGGIKVTKGEAGARKPMVVKKEDDALTWDEYTVGWQRLLPAMTLAGWDPSWVNMFTDHSVSVETHPYRSVHDPSGEKRAALLIYSAMMRKTWHQRLELQVNPMEDLSVWNDDVLQLALEESHARARDRREKLRESQRTSGGVTVSRYRR
ncbi:hypothetical protein DFP72DRAFT_1142541 [Ephemerocybe angulata]|uniref:Uncharacterized protein n=1 Tax=Ephemerocybe angulata TaxID=980116 RepID=A0A8H6HLU9_9AGAR|nr:hypothetical protein DFP72DRAFT_1142541 [Tulosesus angulatus]